MRVDIKQYPVARISTGGGLETASSTINCYAVVQMLKQEGSFVEFQGFSLPNYPAFKDAATQEREIDVWVMNENSSLLYRFPFCDEQRIFLGSPCCEYRANGYELKDREECIQHLLKKGDANETLDHTVRWYQELPGYREGQLQVIDRRQVMACNNWDIDFPAVIQEPLS
jgi:hypothetical protein